MSEIKSCPFCGFEADTRSNGIYMVWVQCKRCCGHGPYGKNHDEATAAWNAAPRISPAERAVLDAAVEWREAVAKCVLGGPVGPDMIALTKEREMRHAAEALARERRVHSSGRLQTLLQQKINVKEAENDHD